MTSRFRNLSVLVSASMLAVFSLQAQNPREVMDIPALQSHLNDTIGFLSSEEQRQIDDRLKAFEKKRRIPRTDLNRARLSRSG